MPPTKNEIAATMSRAQAAQAGVIGFDSVEQARQGLIATNARKLFGFTIKQLPPGFPTEPKSYIFSVSEYGDKVDLGRPFPIFEVFGCPEDKEYGEPCIIEPLYMPLEAKIDTTEFMPHTGPQMVEALLKIGPGMNASWDRRKVGWFVSDTNPPREEDVKRATVLYTQECTRLLQEGNRYAAAGQLNEINETHRRSAKYLKQKVDWSKPLMKMVECPGCGENVKAGIIWHATPMGCGYIFDRKQYHEHFAQPALRTQEGTSQK